MGDLPSIRNKLCHFLNCFACFHLSELLVKAKKHKAFCLFIFGISIILLHFLMFRTRLLTYDTFEDELGSSLWIQTTREMGLLFVVLLVVFLLLCMTCCSGRQQFI